METKERILFEASVTRFSFGSGKLNSDSRQKY